MIIEVWREATAEDLPVRFTVGQSPAAASPPVKSINFYETGAIGGKAYRGPCYVIQFEDSPMRRIIPAHCVVDVLYEVPQKEEPVTVKLED
jgi:hypothetical protein